MLDNADHADTLDDEEEADNPSSMLCAACDDRDEYSSSFHFEVKPDWPFRQERLVCDECGSDRLYVARAASLTAMGVKKILDRSSGDEDAR
jgi:hypothetical protein